MNLEDLSLRKTKKFIENSLDENSLLELVWDNNQLGIQLKTDQKLTPLKLDHLNDFERHRVYFTKNSFYNENLARALGIKKGMPRPRILDATMGMGKDAVLMLAMGLAVTSWERNAWIYLLHLNYRELKEEQDAFPWDQWEQCFGEVKPQESEYSVIYFDPMYNEVSSKSAPKKNMRIFREALAEDVDAKEVALELLAKTGARLVIKRPKKANTLIENPHHQVIGKSTRFDIYQKQ